MFSVPIRSLAWFTASLFVFAAALAVNSSRTATAAPAAPTPALEKPQSEDNPRVKPGLVNWHSTVAEARTASEKSGRPVLVFHMMGQLDRQFC
jgi:hypothetical protein